MNFLVRLALFSGKRVFCTPKAADLMSCILNLILLPGMEGRLISKLAFILQCVQLCIYVYNMTDNFIICSIVHQYKDNQGVSMRRQPQKLAKQYYRVLDNDASPSMSNSEALPSIGNLSARYSYENSPEKEVQRIIKSHHFVYIDLDEENGCKAMDRLSPTGEQEVQKIGNSYIWNLKNLSNRNQQTIDFLSRLRDSQEQKESIRKVLKNELDRSLSKLKQRKQYKLDYDEIRERNKLQFDPTKLKEMVETDQLDAINQNIWQKEKRLIEKLGISDNYVSASPEGKPKKQAKLPHLNYRTIPR